MQSHHPRPLELAAASATACASRCWQLAERIWDLQAAPWDYDRLAEIARELSDLGAQLTRLRDGLREGAAPSVGVDELRSGGAL